jgi:hypothetical protein
LLVLLGLPNSLGVLRTSDHFTTPQPAAGARGLRAATTSRLSRNNRSL